VKLVANEISSTISLFEVITIIYPNPDFQWNLKHLYFFFKPLRSGIVYFNRVADFELYDYCTGKSVKRKKNAFDHKHSTLLSSGVYLVKTSKGVKKRIGN